MIVKGGEFVNLILNITFNINFSLQILVRFKYILIHLQVHNMKVDQTKPNIY